MLCIMIFVLALVDIDYLYASDQKIKIGYVPNYGTLIDSEDENKKGYGYDYFEEISKYTGWEYEYIPCTWEEGLDMLQKGEIDIFGPMQKTLEREEVFEFTEANFGYEFGLLYAPEESPLYYEDFEAFNGMRVGIENQNFYLNEMKSYCYKNNIEVEFVEAGESDIDYELREGKYDVFVSGSLHHIPNIKVVGRIGNRPFYYATTKGNTEILEQLEEALQDIRLNQVNFQENLYHKYYGARLMGAPTYTKEEMDIIRAYPKLVVEIEPWAVPLQYIDSKTGEGRGIVVDLLNEIGKQCGIEFEYISATHDTGECKGTADLYASYHKERYGVPMYFTDKILSVPMVFVAPRALDLSKSLTAGIAQFDNIDVNQLTKRYPNIAMQEYHAITDVSEALSREETDLAVTSLYTFNELVKYGNNKNYLAYHTGIELDIDLGVSKNLPKNFVAILNKARTTISKDKIDSIIFANTIEHVSETSIKAIIERNFVEIFAVIILVLLIIVCLIVVIVCIIYSKKKALQKVAYEDPVTGLSTLTKFKLDIAKVLENAKAGEYALVALDVDNFSYINNWVGYEVGNKVLQVFARELQVAARNHAFLARECADIFLMFTNIKYLRHPKAMDYYSENIVEAIPELKKLNHYPTFNIGIYEITDLKQDISHMIDCANIARRRVKGQYGDSIAEYTVELNSQIQKQRQIILEMGQALYTHEFKIALQPKVNLLTEKIQGAEALVRWYRPNGEVVYPDEFIPLFEQNGFIIRLDLYMFEEICKLIRQWQYGGISPLPRVSVNISQITLLSEGLCETLM
ncbi:MAG: transporter substrate-binding domain-containing protein, partial [Candidatus Niameybacter stercoravium]|nr:transporter substrate-binding domain-containing protein [Candidatus Niameybacter stercoravium]